MRRRRVLQTIGIGGATGLAGCAGVLDGDESETNRNGNSSETEESEPEYSLVSDYDSEVDATESDSYSFTAGVERSQDGETTLLDGEILNAYVIRSNEDYSDEILEQAGLYNEILDELEEDGEGGYTVSTDQLLPGNNLLHLEVEVNDEEHGHQETYIFEEEVQVTTTPERALEQTWIEDRELFQTLRAQHREDDLATVVKYGQGGEEDTTYMDVAEEDVPDRIEEYDTDLDEEPIDERLNIIAGSWNHIIQEITGAGPSGQAARLGYTLEEYEDVETTELANIQHSTVLAYHRDEDKMYHVETGRAGATTFPPKRASFPADNPEKTPLFGIDDETMRDRATGTLVGFGQVGEYDQLTNNLNLSENFLETSMAHIRDGTEMETLVNTMQHAGVSAALSPKIDYEVSGDVNDPEIDAAI